MTTFDAATLPHPLNQYFAAADHREAIGLFAPDARVTDESAVHVGTAQIAAWLDSVEARYHPRYTVKDAEVDGQRTVVTFVVEGTFPGSPATLRQAIVVENDRIASLETL